MVFPKKFLNYWNYRKFFLNRIYILLTCIIGVVWRAPKYFSKFFLFLFCFHSIFLSSINGVCAVKSTIELKSASHLLVQRNGEVCFTSIKMARCPYITPYQNFTGSSREINPDGRAGVGVNIYPTVLVLMGLVLLIYHFF